MGLVTCEIGTAEQADFPGDRLKDSRRCRGGRDQRRNSPQCGLFLGEAGGLQRRPGRAYPIIPGELQNR